MYDARHPDAVNHLAEATTRTNGSAPTKVAPSVLAKVGETFSTSLSSLQRSLAALAPLPPAAQATLDAALREIARLEQFGVQIQELARVFGGSVPAARERIDLAHAAREAMLEWTRAAQQHGASLHGPSAPFELDVNAAALAQLLDLGLEYALHTGAEVEIVTGVQGIPPLPTLTISAQRSTPPGSRPSDEDFDELHWLLFVQLARTVGLVPRRVAAGQTVSLMLSFPEAGAGVPRDAAPSPALLPRTADATGRRILLVEPQDGSRVRAHRVLREAGMRVDAVTTIEKARSSLKDGPPDAVVTGIAVADPRCAGLIDEIRAAQPRLRVIELVDDDNAFSFSAPGSDSPARVGRHDMERTLARAMSQELDAAWANG
ncbi:MAG: hypothetical protein ACXWCC_09580 [Caldimonas sp.]